MAEQTLVSTPSQCNLLMADGDWLQFVCAKFAVQILRHILDIHDHDIMQTVVKSLKELKSDYKLILRQLECRTSVRGGRRPTTNKTVGASETLADGEIRPGPPEPDSPEHHAILAYIKYKAQDKLPHRTYQRDHGISRPSPSTDEYNPYSKNDFLTFVRESTKEASTTGIQPLCQQWYGQVRDIPWLQLGLTWVKGGTGSAEAQRRFKDA